MASGTGKDEEFRNGMPFVGGRLWLDLLNTTPFDGTKALDLIATPEGLRAWLEAADLTGAVEPAVQPRDLQELRETLRTALDRLRTGEPVPPKVVAAINRRLAGVASRYRLEGSPGGAELVETLQAGSSGAAGLIALDFARFVCDYEPQRLKHCGSPVCTMVFYDTGKNATRRWCTMKICGNRDKVTRYRARKAGLGDS